MEIQYILLKNHRKTVTNSGNTRKELQAVKTLNVKNTISATFKKLTY